MTDESLSVIKSIVGAELYEVEKRGKKKSKVRPGRPLVTLSRFYGTPYREVAKLLSERMEVPLYDKKLLNAICKEAKGDKHLLGRLDERVTSLVDDLVHAFFSKKSTNKDAYFRYMAKVIVGIGPSGGVVVGRAAHILLPDRAAFRVRIEGSLKACSKRLLASKQAEENDGNSEKGSKNGKNGKNGKGGNKSGSKGGNKSGSKGGKGHKGVKKADVDKEIEKGNKEWEKFDKDVAKRFPASVSRHDLVINSDIYTPGQMVQVITTAMQQAGFQVPDRPVA